MEKTYLPLFRKYRPQSFEDIVGQENLVKALTNAIELNRIANAYLFCGPRGTGKTSSARIFAKSLNCEKGPTTSPCQKCNSCVDITNATGLDVIEIDAASNRGIQDAKELISQVQYAPINGKYKIFIIDEVHMLSNDAFNALLKTFEEPPKNVIFILATTEPHKVLETIVSRCQRFDLRRITTQDIIKRLREISNLENIKITDDALFTIAKNVSGGLRDSLALLDQVSILGTKQEITSDLINELLGKINFDTLLNLLIDIQQGNIENSIKDIDDIYSKGNEPRNLAENFIEFLRNVIVVLNSKDSSLISSYTTLIKEDIEKILKSNLEKDKLVKILNIFVEYYKEIKISTNPYLWVELGAIACCKLDLSIQNIQNVQNVQKPNISKVEIKPVEKPIEKVEEKVEEKAPIKQEIEEKPKEEIEETREIQTTQPSLEPSPQPVSQPISENVDSAEIWQNVAEKIQSLPARAFYTGVAKLVGVKENKLTLGFLHENLLTQAKSQTKISQLNSAIKETYPNLEVDLIKISPDTKTIEVKHLKPKPTPSYNPPIQPIKQESQNIEPSNDEEEQQETQKIEKYYSDEVKSMIEQFNGKIIEED